MKRHRRIVGVDVARFGDDQTVRSITLPTLTCNRCGHTWYPSKPQRPGTCPNKDCRSKYWNKKRVRKLK